MRISLLNCVLMRFPSNAIHQNHLIEVWQRSHGKFERREPSTALVGLDKQSVWSGDALPGCNVYELIYRHSVQKPPTGYPGLWIKPNFLAHVKRVFCPLLLSLLTGTAGLVGGHLDFRERYTKTQEGGEFGGLGLFNS